MVTVDEVKSLFNLSMSNEEITPHLDRATLDYSDIDFNNHLEEKEAIGSKTIYYLAPHIWSATSQKAREYDETLETFKDVQKFQEYWLNRVQSIIAKYNKTNRGGGVQWQAI